jgi:uncharacterized cupin superfamily protein
VYVISGKPSAWIDGHIYELSEGDGVGFPAIGQSLESNFSKNYRRG